MKIIICGVGSIGSNLVRNLIPDLKGDHEITILDMDTVEERNITPGTQWYSPDQIGIPKVDALQYNVFRWYEREVQIINNRLTEKNAVNILLDQNLIIDCFDNFESRNLIQRVYQSKKAEEVLHIGFSDQFTFSIEWARNYTVPTNITSGMDICEMPGAAGFVASVASLGSLVIEKYLEDSEKMEIVGGKYVRSIVR